MDAAVVVLPARLVPVLAPQVLRARRRKARLVRRPQAAAAQVAVAEAVALPRRWAARTRCG